MFEFVKHHEIVLVILVVAATAWVCWHYERRRDRLALEADVWACRHIWQCAQFHGGGSVYTPKPMNRTEAVEWAGKLGSVAYVDEKYHKIFYRARSGG